MIVVMEVGLDMYGEMKMVYDMGGPEMVDIGDEDCLGKQLWLVGNMVVTPYYNPTWQKVKKEKGNDLDINGLLLQWTKNWDR